MSNINTGSSGQLPGVGKSGMSPMRAGRNMIRNNVASRDRFRTSRSVAVKRMRIPQSVMMESANIHEEMMNAAQCFSRRDLDKIKAKMASYIHSLPSERKMNHK